MKNESIVYYIIFELEKTKKYKFHKSDNRHKRRPHINEEREREREKENNEMRLSFRWRCHQIWSLFSFIFCEFLLLLVEVEVLKEKCSFFFK